MILQAFALFTSTSKLSFALQNVNITENNNHMINRWLESDMAHTSRVHSSACSDGGNLMSFSLRHTEQQFLRRCLSRVINTEVGNSYAVSITIPEGNIPLWYLGVVRRITLKLGARVWIRNNDSRYITIVDFSECDDETSYFLKSRKFLDWLSYCELQLHDIIYSGVGAQGS